MQLMTWQMARLGSRLSLLFEPYERRVMHSALGRFADRPVDLAVGFVEPNGTERVLPFTQQGKPLFNCEQSERFNSITFRGYSEGYKVRFELNVHSVFYPQDEALCLAPAFYLEMRVNPVSGVRWEPKVGDRPEKVKMFLRISRPETQATVAPGQTGAEGLAGLARIDLSYETPLRPRATWIDPHGEQEPGIRRVHAQDRIISLNPEATVDENGRGLVCELPVTQIGSGIKWRLIWGACCSDPVLQVGDGSATQSGRFRYLKWCGDIDAVMQDAADHRDERLALSRRIEKLFDQAPLMAAQRHLINQGFQNFLSNTFWCDLADGTDWFSVWEGSCYFHSTVDVEYNGALFYFAFWPQLLKHQLYRWSPFVKVHADSGGAILSHDIGWGFGAGKQAYPHDMPVEENSNYLLLLQAYSHWTGDLTAAHDLSETVERLAKYLLWTDRTDCGYPTEGTANTIDDAAPATQYGRRQTYLAVKRAAALQAAADMLARAGEEGLSKQCREAAENAVPRIEAESWASDHYAVCADRTTEGMVNAWTDKPLAYDELAGWDAYSIYTGNGLLLPMMIGQPLLLDRQHLGDDLFNAFRETLSPYGCGHSSYEPENVWISQNLWRDHVGSYLGLTWPALLASRYWDMQVMSNTGAQSKGFIDTYINNNLCFYPRGATAMGYMLAQPRIVIDRLAPGGERISVDPQRDYPQRWPLWALADWQARKIPVCVVDTQGRITIESETDPVIIHGNEVTASGLIG